MAVREESSGSLRRSMTVKEIDSETLLRAKNIFNDYKARGIILNHNFDDCEWKLTDQVRNVGFMLIAFEGDFRKSAMQWLGCDYRCFQDCIKAYIVFSLGRIGLAALQDAARSLNRIAGMTSDEAAAISECLNHVVGMLRIMPGGNEERDYVIESLEDRIEQSQRKRCKSKQRQLADFKSYLHFHDILTEFWPTADEKQRLFYFPVYLWWNLTAILPLRPTEFLLIPRDCLRFHNGRHTLTVRRTRLKGGARRIGYRIAEDYEPKEYVIHDALVNELRSYLKATAGLRETAIGTLFLQEPHFQYMNKSPMQTSRYYTYACMNTCLRYFYEEIIGASNKYQDRINLGDTRHIAMTNLIISGGSPVICRELAGHSDIDVSSHYYANVSNLVECVTMEKWRKAKGRSANIKGAAKYPSIMPENAYRVTGGYCDALSVQEGRIDDCLKACDDHGNLGECASCGHYWPDKQGMRIAFYDEKAGRRQVDADSRYLIRMIDLVRKGIGHTEDIGAALLRLQRSGSHYSKCLWEKYTAEDNIKWQDQGN